MEGTAALFNGTGRPFELGRVPLPDPGPGGVLVAVRLANVCGSDLHMWRGELDLERLRVPFPVVLGHEAVGEVVALGEGVVADAAGQPLAPGDRIVWRYFTPCGACPACLSGTTRACQSNHGFISQGRSAEEPPHFVGPYATHLHLPAGQAVFRVPDGVGDAAAAGANCALAEAIQALRTVALRPGETFVVQGAGGVGLYATAVARAMGAGRIVVLDAVPSRLEAARAFGADEAIDVSTLDARARVRAVREATGGRGGDVVGEFVGHAAAVEEGIGMVATGGRYLEVGCVHTGTSFTLDPAYLTLLSRSIVTVIYYEPWALAAAVAFLDRHRDDYPWDGLLAARYPLADIDRAFADADARLVPRATIEPG